MKYALYYTESKAVIQWQDTDVFNYNDPSADQARLELVEDDVPAAFDPFTWPSGWWVVDGELTQVAPPLPLSQIAMQLTSAVVVQRGAKISEGVPLPGVGTFAPGDADLARLQPVALNHAQIGITAVDVHLGQPLAYQHVAAADLETAYIAYIVKREACFSNESAHLSAIAALLAAADRPGLEDYDVTTGWPA